MTENKLEELFDSLDDTGKMFVLLLLLPCICDVDFEKGGFEYESDAIITDV